MWTSLTNMEILATAIAFIATFRFGMYCYDWYFMARARRRLLQSHEAFLQKLTAHMLDGAPDKKLGLVMPLRPIDGGASKRAAPPPNPDKRS